jgi:hypothetical protein
MSDSKSTRSQLAAEGTHASQLREALEGLSDRMSHDGQNSELGSISGRVSRDNRSQDGEGIRDKQQSLPEQKPGEKRQRSEPGSPKAGGPAKQVKLWLEGLEDERK